MADKLAGGANVTPSAALTKAVKQISRPVVGLLLDNGLTYTWYAQILKRIFIDVAESEFGVEGKVSTDSRISLVSGVHRRDVNRLRNEDGEKYEPPASIFLGPKIIAIWISKKKFLDTKGRPASLPRLKTGVVKGGPWSFEELVMSVRKDVRPRSILDEMQRLGVVVVDDNDMVVLQSDSFVPSRGVDEKMYFLGRNVHDHVAASRENVRSDTPPFLERSVYYDQLTPESIEELSVLSRKESTRVLQKLNKHARKLQKRDSKTRDAKERMNFGFYFFNSDKK